MRNLWTQYTQLSSIQCGSRIERFQDWNINEIVGSFRHLNVSSAWKLSIATLIHKTIISFVIYSMKFPNATILITHKCNSPLFIYLKWELAFCFSTLFHQKFTHSENWKWLCILHDTTQWPIPVYQMDKNKRRQICSREAFYYKWY